MKNLWEVEFKARRRAFYINSGNLEVKSGIYVIVAAERGEDMGIAIREYLPEINLKTEPLPILRLATDDDISRLEFNREKEEESFAECQGLIAKHNLDMKLVDVEYQFDCNKLTFYFTADQRVDFRELVKDLAAIYKTRIELRQIGVRDEARRICGYGICGLDQCCSAWLRNFEPITTQMAREQNLALNPQKISGNCGRLLCCLGYEQFHYQETLKELPEFGGKFKTEYGEGEIEKINVFTGEITVKHSDNHEERVSLRKQVESDRGLRISCRRVVNQKVDENEPA